MHRNKRIKLKEFIEHYLEIPTDKFGKMSHKDLKKFNIPGVKCLPIEVVKSNPDLVSKGAILIVEDDYNNEAPYINRNRFTDNIYGFTPEYEEYTIEDETPPQKILRREENGKRKRK